MLETTRPLGSQIGTRYSVPLVGVDDVPRRSLLVVSYRPAGLTAASRAGTGVRSLSTALEPGRAVIPPGPVTGAAVDTGRAVDADQELPDRSLLRTTEPVAGESRE